MATTKKIRIETLDWLRGLMALSIMFYHLTFFTFARPDCSNPLGRLGIYGVSIFFILSGLSMAIVYNGYIKNVKTSCNFFIRRIFRIWPLLWIICFLVIMPELVRTGTYSWKLIVLNLTTLFGFVDHTSYIATGAWSIGNEMVYYALTPLIIYLFNLNKWVGNGIFFITLLVGLFFSFSALTPHLSLAEQWPVYINPFNNLFLYVMGIALYYNFKDVTINTQANRVLLVLSVLLFCFLPFEGDQIAIVTGFGRVVFVALSVVIVFCFYKLIIDLPSTMSRALETFGIATYGVYLFHPVIFKYLRYIFSRTSIDNPILLFGVTAILTVFVSIYSYKYFEARMMKIGKRITS